MIDIDRPPSLHAELFQPRELDTADKEIEQGNVPFLMVLLDRPERTFMFKGFHQ